MYKVEGVTTITALIVCIRFLLGQSGERIAAEDFVCYFISSTPNFQRHLYRNGIYRGMLASGCQEDQILLSAFFRIPC